MRPGILKAAKLLKAYERERWAMRGHHRWYGQMAKEARALRFALLREARACPAHSKHDRRAAALPRATQARPLGQDGV